MLRNWVIFNKLPPEHLTRIKHIHVFEGGRSALYITSGDIVYAIGTNGPYNLLGLSYKQKNFNLVQEPENVERLSLKSIYTIAVGDYFGVANNTNGELYHWGRRMDKRRGILLPHQVKCPYFVTDIACGSEFFVILTKEQKVFFRGSFQQNDHPVAEFTEVIMDTAVSYVSCGIFHVALLGTDGQVYTCGYDHNATYRSWKPEDGLITKKMELREQCVQVVCGRRSTVCVLKSGTVWACGENDNLGVESENSVMKHPAKVKISEPIRELAATWYSNLYAASAWNGRIYSWGYKTRWPTALAEACVMLAAFHNRETPSNLGMVPVAPQLTPRSSFNEKTAIREPNLPISYEVMKRLERSLSADDLSVADFPAGEEAAATADKIYNDANVQKPSRPRSGTQTFSKPKNLPPGLGLLITAGKYLATRPSDRQTNRRRAVSPEAHSAKMPKPTFSIAASTANLASSPNDTATNLTRDRSQSMENLDSQMSPRSKKKPRVLSVIFGLNNPFDASRKTPLSSPQTESPPKTSDSETLSTPGYLTPTATNPFDPRKDTPFYPEIPLPLEDGIEERFYRPPTAQITVEDTKQNVIHNYNPFLYDPMTTVEFKFPSEAAQCYVEKSKETSTEEKQKVETHKNNPGTKVLLEYYKVLADIKSEMSELKNIVNQLADIISDI